jgi:precorrin-6B methylase 1
VRLKELEAVKIIQLALGNKRTLTKTEDELAQLLKKRLTKKECRILNAHVKGEDKAAVIEELHLDDERYETSMAKAIKKLQNETVHAEFFRNNTTDD